VNLEAKPTTFTERLMQLEDWPDELDMGNDTTSIVGVALETLPEDLQEVAYAIFYERISFAELADRLDCSKTQAWRKAQQVKDHMQQSLSDNPIIKERYSV
jgi:DNA-directed RNA polymerase specialized sigma24 family protein